MSNPRFLLAKYVADLSRMEPRNVGIFLWHKSTLASRFLGDDEVPFVNDVDTYRQWIDAWSAVATDGTIECIPGEPVSISKEACIDALLTHQEGNYVLVDAGFVPKTLTKKEMPLAVDYLFDQLVAHAQSKTSTTGSSGQNSLASVCDSLLEKIGLQLGSDFRRNQSIERPVYGVPRHFHCNYVFGPDQPQAVMQRARLSHEQNVNSAAMLMHTLIETSFMPPERCRFLVQSRDINSEAAEEGLNLLKSLCPVIHVDESAADEQIKEVVYQLGDEDLVLS